MNSYEFYQFMQTPEGESRRASFGQLDGCDFTDTIIIAECGMDMAKRWRKEKDAHDYLAEWEKKKGYRKIRFLYCLTNEV